MKFYYLFLLFLFGCEAKRQPISPAKPFYREATSMSFGSVNVVCTEKGDFIKDLFLSEQLKQWAIDSFESGNNKDYSVLVNINIDKKKRSFVDDSVFNKQSKNDFFIKVKVSFKRVDTYGDEVDSFVVEEFVDVSLANMNHSDEINSLNSYIAKMISRIDSKSIEMMKKLKWI
jgi:hypothetical protein